MKFLVGAFTLLSVFAGSGQSFCYAKDKNVEPAQLVTYVKPLAPASASAGALHNVFFTATLEPDGKLHDLTAKNATDEYVPAAQEAASQWVYTPYTRKGKPISEKVYVSVKFSSQEHVPDLGQALKVSTGVVAQLQLNQPVPVPSHMGVGGSVIVRATIGKDGTVEKADAESGPQTLWDAAVREVKAWSYRPFLFDGVPVEVETAVRVEFSR